MGELAPGETPFGQGGVKCAGRDEGVGEWMVVCGLCGGGEELRRGESVGGRCCAGAGREGCRRGRMAEGEGGGRGGRTSGGVRMGGSPRVGGPAVGAGMFRAARAGQEGVRTCWSRGWTGDGRGGCDRRSRGWPPGVRGGEKVSPRLGGRAVSGMWCVPGGDYDRQAAVEGRRVGRGRRAGSERGLGADSPRAGREAFPWEAG